jgi:WD40 repeat protein
MEGHVFTEHAQSDGVPALAFSPDGRLLVSGGVDGTIRVWDAATGEPLGDPLMADTPAAAEGHEVVHDMAFSSDGRLLVAAGANSTVLWDVAERRQLASLGEHEDSVTTLAISPDGRILAAADARGVVALWDLGAMAAIGDPIPHATFVADLAFSPAGDLLAIVVDDGTMVLRETASWRQLGRPIPVEGLGWASRAMFLPDEPALITTGMDGSVARWNLDQALWPEMACRLAGRELTSSEWALHLGDRPQVPMCGEADIAPGP